MWTKPISRRSMLRQSACGFGALGLIGMLNGQSAATVAGPLAPKIPHFAPRAKRIVFLFMHGGPSAMDTFDPKPRLDRDDGKPLPFDRPQVFGDGKAMGNLMKSPWQFKRYGQSGIE